MTTNLNDKNEIEASIKRLEFMTKKFKGTNLKVIKARLNTLRITLKEDF